MKKGEREEAGDYRRVTLMSTAYKIYAAVLAKKIRKETEWKQIIPQNQIGFRKGMETIDNIYVLNYLINKQLGNKKGNTVTLFVDLKVAFDTVDKKILINTMREIGIRNWEIS